MSGYEGVVFVIRQNDDAVCINATQYHRCARAATLLVSV